MTSDSPPIAGIEPEAVSAWLADNVSGFTGPAEFTLIAGGRSNLTYLVSDQSGQRLALRRPPTGSVLESAHDMGREWKFVSALQNSGVPVARARAFCDDHSVTGADFYVMDFVEGIVLASTEDALGIDESARYHASEQAADVLAALHSVDVNGLDVPGSRKTSGYIERQVERWTKQVQSVMPPETDQVVRIAQKLVDDVPPQVTGIAHGDFRLGNMSITPAGEIVAVFDWELATVGDSMADLGWLLSSWSEPGESANSATTNTPTQAPGFMTRDQVAQRYAEKSGNDISRLDFYLAFQRWRGACIQIGVRHRYEVGAMADDGYDHTVLNATVANSLDSAEQALK
ncbi:MAG: phosphotransferase family protein [Cumulibacter sp.]